MPKVWVVLRTLQSRVGTYIHFSTQTDLSLTLPSYIKEFVHGDFGRTKPSLGDILKADCDILQLDVEVRISVFTLFHLAGTSR